MSTPSRAARSRAFVSGRTLKPMMIALSIVARLTSDSVTAPTPRWMMRSCTESSTSILSSDSSSASTAPDTSPLMMRLSDSTLPSSRARVKSSSEMRLRALASWALRSAASRFSAIWRASAVLVGDDERVTGAGHAGETLHLHRTRRVGLERRRRRSRRPWHARGRRPCPRRSSRRRAAFRTG